MLFYPLILPLLKLRLVKVLKSDLNFPKSSNCDIFHEKLEGNGLCAIPGCINANSAAENCQKGKKAKRFLRKYAPYPDCEVSDQMHSKDEGILPQMCDNWFILTNHPFGYYLGQINQEI